MKYHICAKQNKLAIHPVLDKTTCKLRIREMIIVPYNDPLPRARYFPYSTAFLTVTHRVGTTITTPIKQVFVKSPLKL